MKYKLKINDRELEVTLLERKGAALTFEVEGETYSTSIAPILTGKNNSSSKHGAMRGGASNSILAPMPGIIVSLSVKEGVRYSAGDTAIVIEAMKMENSISFPNDAIVEKIHVAEGDEVEGSQLLISIAPVQDPK